MTKAAAGAGSIVLDGLFLSILTVMLAFGVALFCSAVNMWIEPGLLPTLSVDVWQPIGLGLFGISFFLLVFRNAPFLRHNPLPLVVFFFAAGLIAGLILFSGSPDIAAVASL